MLTHLTIGNFAIIDRAELELDTGMTALTGETGAGKSILLDALNLVLGDRADSQSVRDQAERADITAEFDLADAPAARQWLAAQELDRDDQCILRRTVNRDGRSRGFINGQAATLGQLRELGELLVDMHGQHEHQSLLKPEVQRALLDDYGEHAEALAALAEAFSEWDCAEQACAELQRRAEGGAAEIEDLRHQVDSLRALDFSAGEWEPLCEEHSRAAHAGDLLQTGHAALDRLYEHEHALYGGLTAVAQQLGAMLQRDPRLQSPLDNLESAISLVAEASGELRDYVHGLDLDPERLDWLDQRIGAIHQAARRFRIEPEALPGHQAALEQRLDELENLGQHLERLQARREQARQAYATGSARLSKLRRRAGERLGEAVTAIMQVLGMGGGRLAIEIEHDPEARPRPHGQDRVQWLVSANPGQAPRPLQKVASGGELSRISLAIQVVAAHCSGIATLIFDEVDSGIGGGVAEAVGENLRQLGSGRQVLCVTHLAQVAAQAHHHLRVRKHSDSTSTETALEALNASQRVEEIARMLGGREITDRTLDHAREMLTRALPASA